MKISKEKLRNSKNGITLVALIITVIVMMILAGVTVYLSFNGGGLIEKVKQISIVQELKEIEEQIMLKIEEERLNKFSNNENFNISDYTSLESFSPKIESKYSEYIRIDNGKMYIKTNAPEEIKTAAEKLGIQIKDKIINIKIYGDSIQDGTPTPESPVEIQSVGDLVTDKNNPNYGKYRIPVKFTDKEEQTTTENIYLDEPLRKIGDAADYIDFSSGKVIRNIRKYNLTGNEPWALQSTNNNGICNFKTNSIGKINNTLYISNMFVMQGTLIADTTNEGLLYSNEFAFYIRVKQERVSTVTEFIKWLELNNIELYVQLVSENQEPINLPNISTLNGMKNVSVETQIKPSKIEITD